MSGLRSALAAALFSLALLGCGGSNDAPDAGVAAAPQAMRVVGADGAVVVLASGSAGATVRVARDATGAPPLDPARPRASAIYQFSPAGLGVGEAEIRIPFDPALAGAVELAVAQPGGAWSVVTDAREEGGFLVARVARLAYAVALSADTASSSSTGKARALAAPPSRPRLSVTPTTPITQTVSPLQLLAVRQQLTLGFDVDLANAPACTEPYGIEMQALFIGVTTRPGDVLGAVRILSLGTRSLQGPQGRVSFERPLSSADNGSWFFSATATCRRATARPSGLAYLAVAPSGYDVRIAAGELAVFDMQPTDVSAIEGDAATFTAAAANSTSLQWERSNDGGATFAPVPGATGATLTLVTMLADDGARLRLRAGNASGSVLSSVARLSVAERLVAPAISVDPVDQSVLEGETASFTVAGSGKPVPTVQWQQRAATTGAWADIIGATGGTYTTPPLTLAASGSQYRALLTNRAGQAESLVASLTVRARITPPVITGAPQNVTAPAGTLAFLSVTATGTAPLSYRWLRNGGTTGITDLGNSAFVSVDAADIGQTITVTVEVSNPAGTASASATVTVTRSGVTIGAGGGRVDASDGSASLSVPAGALGVDALVSLTRLASGGIALPEGYVALTDAYRIEPSGLAFAPGTPATLTLTGSTPIGDEPPPGEFRALALIRDPQARPLGTRRTATGVRSALPQQANAQRLAAGRKVGTLGTITLPDGQLADFVCPATRLAVNSFTIQVPIARTGTYLYLKTTTDPCGTVLQAPVEFVPRPQGASALSFPTAQDLFTYNNQYRRPWWSIPDADGVIGGFAGLDGATFEVALRNTRPAVVVLQHQFPGSASWEAGGTAGTFVGVGAAAPPAPAASVAVAYRGPTTAGVHNIRAAASQSVFFDSITGQYAGYGGLDSFSDIIGTLEVFEGDRSLVQYPTLATAATPAANPEPARLPRSQPALSVNFGEIYLAPQPGGIAYDIVATRTGQGFNGAPPVVLSIPGVASTTPVLGRRTPDGEMEVLAYVRDGNVVARHFRRGAEGDMSIGTAWTLTGDSRMPVKLAVAHAGEFSGAGATDFVLAVVTQDGAGVDLIRFETGGPVSTQTLPDGPCTGPKRISHMVSAANRRKSFDTPTDATTRAALLFQGQGPANTASTCVAVLRNGSWSVEQLWTSANTLLSPTEAATNAIDIDFDGTVVVAESSRVEGSGAFLNVALRTDTGTWQRRANFGVAVPGDAPDVVFDPTGNVTLVFASPATFTTTADGEFFYHNNILASRFSAGSFSSGLGSVQSISPPFVDASQPRLSINSAGTVLAAFVLDAGLPGGEPAHLLASRLYVGNGWTFTMETVAGVNGSRMLDPWMHRYFDLGPVPYTPAYFGGSGYGDDVFWLESDPSAPGLRRRKAGRN